MNIIVFEDAGVEKLFPITTGRAAYAISCASFRLIDWLNQLDGRLVGVVRPYLESMQLQDFPNFATELSEESKWTLVVNARMAPSLSNFMKLKDFMGSPDGYEVDCQSKVARSEWAIAAAVVPTETFTNRSVVQWPNVIDEIPSLIGIDRAESDLELFSYPHDVIAQNTNAFQENIAYRIASGNYSEKSKGVFVGENVAIDSSVVFDSRTGPIVVDHNTKIGPFSFLRGPVYLGVNCKVSEHASIKDDVSISHTCKIGGEVEAAIFEAYSNKQHHGFLGHSYVGSWINLGAGTCNSDLKNTYGIVNVQYGDEKISTGMQFVGCVIGDYAKTAINTCIFTGKLIGTASMVYGFATTNVPSFTNYARTFNKVGELPPEVIVTTQKRMFARRDVTQRACDIQLVHDMFRVTDDERPDDLSRTPISL